ncbi:hypothetical protein ERO13_A06G178900v2 [Gossypium hirsutum]|nr:hypothetical protein ERO13_A06G178900v2 [Gossypium hirsutum]
MQLIFFFKLISAPFFFKNNQRAFCSLPYPFYFLCLANSRASSVPRAPPRIVAHGSGMMRRKGVSWPDMHAGERGFRRRKGAMRCVEEATVRGVLVEAACAKRPMVEAVAEEGGAAGGLGLAENF